MKRLTAFLLPLLLIASQALAAPHLGDFPVGDTAVCGYFNTFQPSTGAAFTLASGAVRVTKGSSATEDDSGITLDNDFDSVTGRHQVCIDTSSDGTFYSDDGRFFVYLSAGTVDSVSVVGANIFSFTLGVLETSADIATAVETELGDGSSLTALATAANLTSLNNDVDDIATAVGSPSDLGSGASLAANAADIEAQTDDIGAAGVGLTAVSLADGAIDAGAIGTAAIDADAIAANAIGASEIADGAIDAGAIAADAIGASEIATDAIGSAELAATAAAEIVDNWETQSQADPTGFEVNVKEMNDAPVCGDGDATPWTGDCP